MSATKNMPLNWYFKKKKIEKDSDNFWHRKLTLKVRNFRFSIAWFRAEVDMKKFCFMKKCYFSLNQPLIWCASCWKNLKCYLTGIYHSSKIYVFDRSYIITNDKKIKYRMCIMMPAKRERLIRFKGNRLI